MKNQQSAAALSLAILLSVSLCSMAVAQQKVTKEELKDVYDEIVKSEQRHAQIFIKLTESIEKHEKEIKELKEKFNQLSTLPEMQFKKAEIRASNQETLIAIEKDSPVSVIFPAQIAKGWTSLSSTITLDRDKNKLIVLSAKPLTEQGEAMIVELETGERFAVRFVNPSANTPKQTEIEINPTKPVATITPTPEPTPMPTPTATATIVAAPKEIASHQPLTVEAPNLNPKNNDSNGMLPE